ncbi:MAG: hypothetical protein EB127_04230 [Alphaproteobacteria bacterium]|nr:hypothetical protein [Alphaproteobacteria bacterium]
MRILYLCLCLALVSCVSSYDNKEIIRELSLINLDIKCNTPEEYEFEHHLNKLLNYNIDSHNLYKLRVQFDKNSNRIAVQTDSDTVRESVTLNVKFELLQESPGKPDSLLMSQSFRVMGSYNTLFSPYSTDLEMQKTIQDLYITSAEEIRRRLIIFLRSKAP